MKSLLFVFAVLIFTTAGKVWYTEDFCGGVHVIRIINLKGIRYIIRKDNSFKSVLIRLEKGYS